MRICDNGLIDVVSDKATSFLKKHEKFIPSE